MVLCTCDDGPEATGRGEMLGKGCCSVVKHTIGRHKFSRSHFSSPSEWFPSERRCEKPSMSDLRQLVPLRRGQPWLRRIRGQFSIMRKLQR